MLITSVLHILDQREYDTKASPPAPSEGFRTALSEVEDEKPVVGDTRAATDNQKEAESLTLPPLPQEPLFTTLPSPKVVDEFLRAMEEVRAKAKSRSVDIFE